MVEHATLLKRLSCSFGVSGVTYSWIRSYPDGRTQSVRYGLVLVSCDFMLCRCIPRIRPGATTVFCIYVSSVNHRQISPGLSAAICGRYAALCRFVAYQETLDRHYKIRPSTDHRAKFYATRPTILGDLELKKNKKLETWGKAQRESARCPKSDWGKLDGGG